MKKYYNLNNIDKLSFKLSTGMIIFLKGDLGTGKTTLTKHILNNLLNVGETINSPTYTYYNKYIGILNGEKIDIYHFDLYKLNNYDEFFAIGAEDILDNNNGIILIEWPEIIENYYKANLEIKLEKTNKRNERKLILK